MVLAAAHASGVLSKDLTVVLPETVLPAKLEKIKSYLINVILHGAETGLAEKHAQHLAASGEYTYISPYNDLDIVADKERLESKSWSNAFNPQITICGVSATNSQALAKSISSGRVVEAHHFPTLAEAVAGGLDEDTVTLALAQSVVDHVIKCEENDILSALKTIAFHENMIMEGSAALALAGYNKYADRLAGQTSVILLCGANICVDGRTATITTSLNSALTQFRHPANPRLLWADALCINQKDTAEKTVQVQLMADVYRYAVQVLVWLGPDADGLEEFFPTVYAASRFISVIEARYNSEPEGAIELQRQMMRLSWEPILELFLWPWFTRKWVVQEVALPKHVVMCYGNLWFPFHTLGMITLALVDWPVSAGLVAQWDKKYFTGLFNAYFLHSVHRNKVNNCGDQEDILSCLVWTKLIQCSVPHDHIYGLLGLLDTFGASLKPDYQCSPADAFARFAIWNLVEEERPEVLCIPSKPDGQIILPSWVPDLSNMQDIHPIANHTLRLFSAGGQQAPQFTVSADRKILSCLGRIIVTIENYTCCVSKMQLPEEIPESLACERLAAENMGGLPYNDNGSNDGNAHGKTRLPPDRFEQFRRTMPCGFHFSDGGYHRPKPSVGTTLARYFDLLGDSCSESRYKQFGSVLW
ncbi:unnamed protein product [Clonostachys rhizophaga]|uniref:Heterokaryon incompatibility domain-containing protein n=1 Tax=Clonostachys rhizophaga TaxID=160324 RepID=A0A9N9VVM3_9HYPO|nr:unnamed protein product [Clonostachys rhizophaga]